jgi:DNA-binding ferritin-like protein
MKEEFIIKLVQIQLQFKFLHWQTTGDAKHRLYGKIYDKLGDLIDEFTETMMGKQGRPEFQPEFGIMFQDISNLKMQNFMDGITEFLVSMSDHLDSRYDTDLLNLRDEMLSLINKSKYLMTLKY